MTDEKASVDVGQNLIQLSEKVASLTTAVGIMQTSVGEAFRELKQLNRESAMRIERVTSNTNENTAAIKTLLEKIERVDTHEQRLDLLEREKDRFRTWLVAVGCLGVIGGGIGGELLKSLLGIFL